jgi:hypothetical protein
MIYNKRINQIDFMYVNQKKYLLSLKKVKIMNFNTINKAIRKRQDKMTITMKLKNQNRFNLI